MDGATLHEADGIGIADDKTVVEAKIVQENGGRWHVKYIQPDCESFSGNLFHRKHICRGGQRHTPLYATDELDDYTVQLMTKYSDVLGQS